MTGNKSIRNDLGQKCKCKLKEGSETSHVGWLGDSGTHQQTGCRAGGGRVTDVDRRLMDVMREDMQIIGVREEDAEDRERSRMKNRSSKI